eukprot:snap_masked-scaffold_33-processed-gene-1.16-mRNA-1 protein AED:0.24 eAED:0.28 QI:0/0/0/0.5/1/1/2/0/288
MKPSFPNKRRFQEKISKLKKDGFSNLHIITDFDMTLTHGESTHEIIVQCPSFSTEFRNASRKLFEKYYPIEFSHILTKEEKIPHMLKWYAGNNELILKSKMTNDELGSAVRSSSARFRPKVDTFFEYCNRCKIPVLIFSAGFANIIQVMMNDVPSFDKDMVKIVGNYVHFGFDGKAESFSEPPIHMFNKNESVALKTVDKKYVENIKKRSNAILLGDGVGDIHMADGLHAHDVVLKIGFFTHHGEKDSEKKFEKYKEVFDILFLVNTIVSYKNTYLIFSQNRLDRYKI